MTRTALAVALAVVTLVSLHASAQQADRSWVIRGVWIAPDDDSPTVADTGSRLAVNTTASAELAMTYLVTNTIAVEGAVSATRLDVSVHGGAASGFDGGRVWMAPVTLTVQYRMPLFSDFHPYAGVGIATGVFFDYELSRDMGNIGLVDMDWQGELDFAAQLGLDYDAGERWFVNLDARYLDLGAEVELFSAGHNLYDEIELEVQPWVLGLGVGYRF